MDTTNRDAIVVTEESIYKDTFDFRNIHRSKAYEECMTYFDSSDKMTNRILLSVDEGDQSMVMQRLATKLYGYIISKIDGIDFGTIPMSKGDITKIEKYSQLNACLSVLGKILENYKQPTDNVNTVIIAINNLKDRKELFKKAYKLNVELPIVVYNTIALSIVSSVSLLITAHIEFIKLANDDGYDIAFDKASDLKSKDKILFTNLERFNDMCASGELDRSIEYIMENSIKLKAEAAVESADLQKITSALNSNGLLNNDTTIHEGGVLSPWITGAMSAFAAHPIISGIVGVVVFVWALILLIRNLIYFFYYYRVKISQMFDSMTALIYMNTTNIQNNLTKSPKEKKDIIAKQNGIAKYFQKLAEYLRVKDSKAEIAAKSDIKKDENKKFVYKDVLDQIPNSANAGTQSSLF